MGRYKMNVSKESKNKINEEDGFNKEKFKQVLHYVINECGSIPNVGKTVLFKILYFSDFDYYELYEKKMTGEFYYKLPHGPAPSHFDETVEELEKEGKIERCDRKYGTYDQQKFFSLQEPDISLLSGREVKIIDKDIKKFSNFNASQISALSHRDMPYRATEENDIIEYELVFYRDSLFSVREYPEDD